MSSKFTELFIYRNDRVKQILLVYKLLKLNNDRYNYISISCNCNLAYQFEKTSPQQAMRFIDAAISLDLQTKYYLPHSYHMKGRLYYNQKDYVNARYYFNKALQVLKPTDKVYIASMYNNLGMVDDKLNNMKQAIKNTQKGINILEPHVNPEDLGFLNLMKGNLGSYFFKIKDYQSAEKLFIQQFEFQQSHKDMYSYEIESLQKLFDLYSMNGQKENQKKIIDYLKNIEPKLDNTSVKIETNEIYQKYYSNNNDLQQLKTVAENLIKLNTAFNDEKDKSMTEISDMLNNEIIKSVDDKYQYEVKAQKRKSMFFIILALISVLLFILIFLNIRYRIKKERLLRGKEKELLENKKKLLEQNINFQEEKIKNLHQNLNLKIETEKVFLDNLRKIRKSQSTDSEQMMKDLFLKMNNLIQIDKKNNDLLNESSLENKQFLNKLKELYPSLTEKELKLCKYFRMNLSSKEISTLENTTTGTIRVYKTKIKSKLELDRENDISVFLNKI
ncbi:DNA-binding CsgD family transcriptional regulator [Chryseobacterium sediminis]|uniref:DNA-binding CsgD family transcriptional regulator n=1 Tax=Chryseobacterium sediminis TaxID=1679494 RepID=A0ABR6PTW0_9FLAO|nr:hypothetical protein [Chryseobacterium sediminis]MBB6329137.1 DNA-binding CsgD family transcriptional regulator [Chryseobacterium sediminis]